MTGSETNKPDVVEGESHDGLRSLRGISRPPRSRLEPVAEVAPISVDLIDVHQPNEFPCQLDSETVGLGFAPLPLVIFEPASDLITVRGELRHAQHTRDGPIRLDCEGPHFPG